MGSLTSLRRLDIRETSLEKMPQRLGRLSYLQMLSNFVAETEWSYNSNESRYETVETDVFDVLEARESLQKLTINYYGGKEFPLTFSQRSQHCRNGWYKACGAEFLGDANPSIKPFPLLEILKFENMKEWEEWSFENRVEAFPCLRQPSILRCPILKKFSYRFPSLEKLKVRKCEALESFTGLSQHENLESDEFPCLRSLTLVCCTKLIELPKFLLSLGGLKIDGCLELGAFPRLVNLQKLEFLDSNAKLVGSIVDFSSLTFRHKRLISFVKCLHECIIKQFVKLVDSKIAGCGDLEGLSNELVGLKPLASLQHLTICHCPKLVALLDEEIKLLPELQLLDLSYFDNLKKLPCELQKFNSFRDLRVDWCPKLESFPEQGLPGMLQLLVIRDCGALKTLPNMMLQNNKALEYLEIHKCSSLTSLLEQGDLPTTLKHVKIYYCKNLASLPDGIMCKDKLTLEYLEIDNCFPLSSFQE
ncbi:putative disease resistance protein RGA4 [Herrania umbratica]|uniref:Disease resistance protein RGA4 n=1 Tax=Herrania umbratica TaxID=108875 RepID=A0A6J1B5A2_9ROSI|nr:putative disease resistance protein RGA4 [Herrania umbratica]